MKTKTVKGRKIKHCLYCKQPAKKECEKDLLHNIVSLYPVSKGIKMLEDETN